MPVFTFLERFDFSGKTIRPFCTHEGSGMGCSVSDIKRICPDAIVEQGLALARVLCVNRKGSWPVGWGIESFPSFIHASLRLNVK